MKLQLSALAGALIIMAFFLLLCIFAYLFACLVQLEENKGFLTGAVLIASYEWVMFQVMLNVHAGAQSVTSISLMLILVSLALFVLFDVVMLTRVVRKKRNTITPMSIKEAMDKLPIGICLYYPNGLCKLANLRMTEICAQMRGETVLNGQLLWETVMNRRITGGEEYSEEKGALVRLDSGAVYSAHRRRISYEDGMLYELTLADVTEEYALSEELREKQEHAKLVNRRLRVLGDKISEITREKEILDSKIRLHDDWGRALLLLRRCILNPGGTDILEAFREFNKNLAIFDSERSMAKDENEQSREDIVEAARALGIAIECKGEFPEDERNLKVVNLAMVACVSNISRHTQGHLLSVYGEREEDKYRLLFTNDGELPHHEIKEEGGLKNLRRRVESVGGRMWIESDKNFELWVELKGEQDGD